MRSRWAENTSSRSSWVSGAAGSAASTSERSRRVSGCRASGPVRTPSGIPYASRARRASSGRRSPKRTQAGSTALGAAEPHPPYNNSPKTRPLPSTPPDTPPPAAPPRPATTSPSPRSTRPVDEPAPAASPQARRAGATTAAPRHAPPTPAVRGRRRRGRRNPRRRHGCRDDPCRPVHCPAYGVRHRRVVVAQIGAAQPQRGAGSAPPLRRAASAASSVVRPLPGGPTRPSTAAGLSRNAANSLARSGRSTGSTALAGPTKPASAPGGPSEPTEVAVSSRTPARLRSAPYAGTVAALRARRSSSGSGVAPNTPSTERS